MSDNHDSRPELDGIEFVRKDAGSAGGQCPALFRAPGGGFYLQGRRVANPAVRARLAELGAAHDSGLAPDEEFMFVPGNVLYPGGEA